MIKIRVLTLTGQERGYEAQAGSKTAWDLDKGKVVELIAEDFGVSLDRLQVEYI